MANGEVPVHALRGSRMPQSMPGARRNRATRERERGFEFGQLQWMRLLHHGLPFQRSQIESHDGKGVEMLAVRGPRGCRFGAGVHQGMPNELPDIWNARRPAEE